MESQAQEPAKTPAAQKRETEAAAYHGRRKKKDEKPAPSKEWFALSGSSVVKKTKTALGTHSVFVCSRKEADKRGLKYEK